MSTVWIGDFRCKPLKLLERTMQMDTDNAYLIDDYADYSWFGTSGLYQLEKLSPSNTSIVIMLGFTDCVNCCLYNSLNIEQIAASYSNYIETLISNYPTSSFYFCSVNPVNGDYAASFAKDSLIAEKTLNSKIDAFNKKIKASCKATFIDSYEYLIATNFQTRDGIHYTHKTSEALHSFVISYLADDYDNAFKPRLTAPELDNTGDTAEADPMDDFWIHTSHGGENPFPIVDITTGSTLPNCTAYAWGRFYEILGTAPTLSTENVAAKWWDYESDGYRRGQTPELGAIACWQSVSVGSAITGGHLAVVEQINPDGGIVTSESDMKNPGGWQLKARTNENNNWGEGSEYKFQGFIYSLIITPVPGTVKVDKSEVTSCNESLSETKHPGKKKINAQYIWNYLGSRGWSLNAVAGMLGNMEHESSINPGRGEVGGSGFGLVQWTPKSKFTNWLHKNYPDLPDNDIDGQLERIIAEKDNGWQYGKTKNYNYTFEEFSTSQESPYNLACAFAWNYERSGIVIWGFNRKKHSKRCNYGKPKQVSTTVCRQCYQEKYGEEETIRRAEINRENLRKKRGTSGEKWYKYLHPYAPTSTFENKLIVESLKADKLAPTEVFVSFVTKNAKSYSYEILNANGTVEVTKETSIEANSTSVVTSIFSHSGLIPNNTYTIKLNIKSAVSDESAEKSLIFKTPQMLPESVSNITIKAIDQKIPSNNFLVELDLLPDSAWGYWKDNGSGYIVQLVVNGKVLKEKIVTTPPKTIKISDYFDYKAKIGDTIQIGIRTWVKYNGDYLYDGEAAKCSNPICMLAKPVTAYLNI